jgi:hypothetical protein
MAHRRSPKISSALAAILTAAGAVGGCASDIPRRAAPAAAGDPAQVEGRAGVEAGAQGGAWEAVFLPAATTANLERTSRSAAPELARLDDELPVGRGHALLATAQWPEPLRPTLERTRRISFPRDASTQLFFLPPREVWRWDGWDRRAYDDVR